MASRGPGQRAGLTRDAVLRAATSVLVERGLDALTMRALADDLGVAPNALYSHVASKGALIDDLLDDVLAAVVEPATDDDPPTGLRAVMTSTYEVLLTQPSLVPAYLARQGAHGPNALRLGKIMDDLLVRAGHSSSSMHAARRVLIVYTIGFAAFTAQVPAERGDGSLTKDDSSETFVRGLDWLLAGIVQAN